MTERVGAEDASAGVKLSRASLIIGFIAGLRQLFFPIVAILFGAGQASGQSHERTLLALILIAAILAASLLFQWIRWTRFRYYTGEEDIRIESGVIGRTARSIPYERIQDVGIEQKPLARLFGLGAVKFETGGGGGDDAKLSYVTLAEAERLRILVRAHKSGAAGEAAAATKPADSEGDRENDPAASPLFAMDTARVLTLGFYSFSLVIFALLGGAAQQFDFLISFDLYDIGAWLGLAKDNGAVLNQIGWNARIFAAISALIALVAIGCASGIIRSFLREYGFRLDATPRGFRRRRGLLTLTDVVLPLHRVQAATITTGPIRKRAGWHALKFISLASDNGNPQKGDSDHVAAPLATMAEIGQILAVAKIDPAHLDAHLLRGHFSWWLVQMIAAILVIVAGMAVLALAAGAGWRALLLALLLPIAMASGFLQWRYSKYAITPDMLLLRGGWWQQNLTIAPQMKIQTVEISAGPVARILGLCKIHFGIAGGALAIPAVKISDAKIIAAQIIERVAATDYSKISVPAQADKILPGTARWQPQGG